MSSVAPLEHDLAHAEADSWGQHLLLDLKGCDVDVITDADALRTFSRDLVERIEMKAYGEPLLAHFAEHKPEAAGWSLVQLIETSSITGHFCDLTGDAYLDVFSCKPIDVDAAVELVNEQLRPDAIRKSLVARQA